MDWNSLVQPAPKQTVMGQNSGPMPLPQMNLAPPQQPQGPSAGQGIASGISSTIGALGARKKQAANLDATKQGDAPTRIKTPMTWDFPQGDMNV